MRSRETEEGLLAAIRAAPEEDAPRLVYADWLQEQGEPQGELIHLQCELARPIGDARDARHRQMLVREEAQLLASQAGRLEARYLAWMKIESWRRGFPSRVELAGLAAAFDRAAELSAMVPVEHVALAGDGGRVGFGPGFRHLYRLRSEGSSSDSGPVTYYESHLHFEVFEVARRARVAEWSGLSYWDDAGGGHESGRVVGWGFSPAGDRFVIRWKDRSVALDLEARR